LRVVPDTNTVLSALLFPRGHLAWLRELWTSGRILPLVCRATARELIQALTYPKFKLDEDEIRTLLAAYLPFTDTVDVKDHAIADLPLCSDPDDQVFLRLAATGRADVLVSGDRALLALAGRVPFAVDTAAQFKKRFEPQS
jgi:putative PIN family toxin of toxin-antitoxin system